MNNVSVHCGAKGLLHPTNMSTAPATTTRILATTGLVETACHAHYGNLARGDRSLPVNCFVTMRKKCISVARHHFKPDMSQVVNIVPCIGQDGVTTTSLWLDFLKGTGTLKYSPCGTYFVVVSRLSVVIFDSMTCEKLAYRLLSQISDLYVNIKRVSFDVARHPTSTGVTVVLSCILFNTSQMSTFTWDASSDDPWMQKPKHAHFAEHRVVLMSLSESSGVAGAYIVHALACGIPGLFSGSIKLDSRTLKIKQKSAFDGGGKHRMHRMHVTDTMRIACNGTTAIIARGTSVHGVSVIVCTSVGKTKRDASVTRSYPLVVKGTPTMVVGDFVDKTDIFMVAYTAGHDVFLSDGRGRGNGGYCVTLICTSTGMCRAITVPSRTTTSGPIYWLGLTVCHSTKCIHVHALDEEHLWTTTVNSRRMMFPYAHARVSRKKNRGEPFITRAMVRTITAVMATANRLAMSCLSCKAQSMRQALPVIPPELWEYFLTMVPAWSPSTRLDL
jgi:hypothetical protein